MTAFFYQLMGEAIGPVSAKELRRLALEGRIDHETPVRTEGRDRWIHAERVAHLFDPESDSERAEAEAERVAHEQRRTRRVKEHTSLADVLLRHVDSSIGINYRSPETIEFARLLAVSSDHFTVRGDATGLIYHFPIRMVLSAIEAEEGSVAMGGFFSLGKTTYSLVVQVYHMVIYKGAIGIGMEF